MLLLLLKQSVRSMSLLPLVLKLKHNLATKAAMPATVRPLTLLLLRRAHFVASNKAEIEHEGRTRTSVRLFPP
jgi:hypothetical protein